LVAKRVREKTSNFNDGSHAKSFEKKGGRLVRGHGRLDGPGRVVVGESVIEASRAVVLNPGTMPTIPPVDGLEGTPFWTNHDAIETEELPASMIVMGGGSIGVELSQVFARFGTEVTVVEGADRIISMEEPEASELLTKVFDREGIKVRTGMWASGVAHNGETFKVSFDGGGSLEADRLLVATGRHADLAALGIGSVGADEKSHFIDVDERMRVCQGVWAIGDATGKGAFTHISMYQAEIALADILGEPWEPADYRDLSRVTFTDPEIGSVGMIEATARSEGIEVRTGYTEIPDSTRGWVHGPGNDGFIKLIEDANRGVLVGATSVGPTGGEVLSMLTLAVHEEIPVTRLRSMIYAYPTFHRAVISALDDLSSRRA
ncbi:MAG TPA: NAD(P)/FAD-dependent oxidoreductase, partial [Acidimicrobiales bacterium]|nr:NAD(P)/FAD-dependent oxidoreductase [Acidimicrobiales bacterium]